MPKLLIGLADVNLIQPLETRSGHSGKPIAVLCALGSGIYGPYNTTTETSQGNVYLNVHRGEATNEDTDSEKP